MADCLSCTNTAEVVNFLRGEAKELSTLANGKTECNPLWKAADALEQAVKQNAGMVKKCDELLAENASLKNAFERCYESNENLYNELQEVKAERDAAVRDLKISSDCDFCKYNTDDPVYCEKSPRGDECMGKRWEWRGVQNDG